MKLDAVIYIKVPQEEKKLIQEAAKQSGRTMSNYIRYIMAKAAKGINS